jgi:MFS family permease
VTFGFTTAIVPAAYLGAFLRGCAGATFYTLGATVIQQLSPADATGRVFGVSGMLGSVADTVALPAAGLVVAELGVRPGAALLAAVPLAVGLALLAPVEPRSPASGCRRCASRGRRAVPPATARRTGRGGAGSRSSRCRTMRPAT